MTFKIEDGSPTIYTSENGVKILFDDRYGDLIIRDKEGVEETIRLTPVRDIFKKITATTKFKFRKGTMWIDTGYVPLGCGCHMKQSDWEHKVKSKGLKVPVLALISKTYADR